MVSRNLVNGLGAAVFAVALLTLAAGAHAQGRAKVVNFAKSGNWRVNAVYSKKGSFNHCSAAATYRSGTRVAFIAYASGLWRLQFYKKDWPQRSNEKFPASLVVDKRTVLRGDGFFRGRSAFIDLGRSTKRVIALMRGKVMMIRTPSGTSSFRLDGTFNAATQVARCWKAKNRTTADGAFANRNGGAFGGRNSGGAFGGQSGRGAQSGAFGNSSRSKSRILPRGQTLDLATSYLSGINRPYSILPKHKNVLKHFPVNWKFNNGLVGGMKVYIDSRTPPRSVLKRLVGQQAANCKGRSATEQEKPLRLKSGRIVQRARGVCDLNNGSVLNVRYRVSRLKRNLLMVIMLVGAKKQFGGDAAGGNNRQPAPNEL